MIWSFISHYHKGEKQIGIQFFLSLQQVSAGAVRRFIKPLESLEQSLELSRHRGRKRTQKRPNYKNLGEEDDERAGEGGSSVGGDLEEGWADDSVRGGEKGKGTEGIGGGGSGSSKGSRASGEMAEGECLVRRSSTGLCLSVVYTHQLHL